MPSFDVDVGGRKFRINAPEGATQADAQAFANEHYGQQGDPSGPSVAGTIGRGLGGAAVGAVVDPAQDVIGLASRTPLGEMSYASPRGVPTLGTLARRGMGALQDWAKSTPEGRVGETVGGVAPFFIPGVGEAMGGRAVGEAAVRASQAAHARNIAQGIPGAVGDVRQMEEFIRKQFEGAPTRFERAITNFFRKPGARGAVAGGVAGATQPKQDDEYWMDTILQVGLGTIVGGVLGSRMVRTGTAELLGEHVPRWVRVWVGHHLGGPVGAAAGLAAPGAAQRVLESPRASAAAGAAVGQAVKGVTEANEEPKGTRVEIRGRF